MKDIILDVDTGIDDALALILAGRLTHALRIVGVTTVAGNVDLATATENTRAVLGLIGRADVPVAAGAAGPIARPLRTAPEFHGAGGLGDLDPVALPFPRPGLLDENAAAFIAREAREHPGEIAVIAAGPLTNLARALELDAAVAGSLAGVVVMGGAIGVPGNASPVAEANFFADPEAARAVLSAGLPITLVPLDVTEQVAIDRPRLDALRRPHAGRHSPVSDFALEILDFYLRACESYGRSAAALHDPLAVAIAAVPELADTTPLAVEIPTLDPLTAGQCVVDRRPRSARRPEPTPNVQACLQVLVDPARQLILGELFSR
ncbi:MAG: nucleoside hydrolase [Chloroflexota bacterium]